MATARTIMPHDKLDDAAYALVVNAIDSDASKDEPTRKMFKEGIARLGRRICHEYGERKSRRT